MYYSYFNTRISSAQLCDNVPACTAYVEPSFRVPQVLSSMLATSIPVTGDEADVASELFANSRYFFTVASQSTVTLLDSRHVTFALFHNDMI